MIHRKQMKIFGLWGVKYTVLDLGNKSYYDYHSYTISQGKQLKIYDNSVVKHTVLDIFHSENLSYIGFGV